MAEEKEKPTGGRRYRPGDNLLRFSRALNQKIMGAVEVTSDMRMTEAQLHAGVVKVYGCEPLILAAKLTQMTIDKRSAFYGQLPVALVLKQLLEHHDRINPTPERALRRRGEEENQFELNFEWQNGIAMMGAAE